LDVLVSRKETTLAYINPTHTDRYLNFNSNYPPHMKRGLFRVFTSELPPYAKNAKVGVMKLVALDVNFSLTIIDSFINLKVSSHPSKEEKPLGSVYFLYMKSVSEEVKRVGNRYNVRTIFRTKHTLRSSYMKPDRTEIRIRCHSVYSIPRECGRSYIGETGRHIALRLREHSIIPDRAL
jgi:hypothetical protein